MAIFDGRGRWYRWDKRSTTDDYRHLDMASFARSVDLDRARIGFWGWSVNGKTRASIGYRVIPGQGVRLRYTVNQGKPGAQDLDYLVVVTFTTPGFGGRRAWWLCPNCGRRVRILYGGKVFVCRDCAGAYYATQQNDANGLTVVENDLYRIRRKLGARDGAITAIPPWRPKGMHNRTYSRLVLRYRALQKERDGILMAELVTRFKDHWVDLLTKAPALKD